MDNPIKNRRYGGTTLFRNPPYYNVILQSDVICYRPNDFQSFQVGYDPRSPIPHQLHPSVPPLAFQTVATPQLQGFYGLLSHLMISYGDQYHTISTIAIPMNFMKNHSPKRPPPDPTPSSGQDQLKSWRTRPVSAGVGIRGKQRRSMAQLVDVRSLVFFFQQCVSFQIQNIQDLKKGMDTKL